MSFGGYNPATSFKTFEDICNTTDGPLKNVFTCFLYEFRFKIELIGFGYICWSFEALIILISIFALWDSLIIYDFVCENPSATDGNRGYWVTGYQTKGSSCFYDSISSPIKYKIIKNILLYVSYLPSFLLTFSRFICLFFNKFYNRHNSTPKIISFITNLKFVFLVNIGVIIRVLSGKFQGLEDYSGRVLRCYSLYCFGSCNSSSFDRCQKAELENFVYNLFDCFPKIFPSIFLLFSILFSLSLIFKIAKQLKYQIQHKRSGLISSLKISIICFSQAFLLALIFGISLFSKFPEIYDLGANGGTMWTDVDTFYKKLPLWLNILKEPLTVKSLNIIRIWIDSIMILMVLKGYRNSCKFMIIETLTVASVTIIAAATYFPEYLRARLSAQIMFEMMNEEPKIDGMNETGTKPIINGNIDLKNGTFSYPNGGSHLTLNNLSISVLQGKNVALVGPSGSGKSTVIQLLERFYDTLNGFISLDKTDIRQMNVPWLRNTTAVVGQENILFNLTIKENISYGMKEEVSMSKIIEAAKLANIHDFIESLPEKYETNIGNRGTQLSGGQRQKIVIARAIIRDPKILLLDEATSALDTESERIVQEALERASQGRTCITVAHRLSTIQNADLIVVIRDGKVVEYGNHQQLQSRKGLYFRMVQKQHMD